MLTVAEIATINAPDLSTLGEQLAIAIRNGFLAVSPVLNHKYRQHATYTIHLAKLI